MMKMHTFVGVVAAVFLSAVVCVQGQTYTVESPDSGLSIENGGFAATLTLLLSGQ